MAALLAPAGLLLCFFPLTDASLFLGLYGVTAVYFSGVMVRCARCAVLLHHCPYQQPPPARTHTHTP